MCHHVGGSCATSFGSRVASALDLYCTRWIELVTLKHKISVATIIISVDGRIE